MRTKYTVINLLVSVGGQLFSILLSFISRMFFIHYLSAEYLGLNGLFTDVLGILNLAELGIGTAMIFSLYETGQYEGAVAMMKEHLSHSLEFAMEIARKQPGRV